jgi:arylsulfatase A-like enzyme
VNEGYYVAPRSVPLRDLEDVYDAEVASLDRELRGLFDALERASFLERAIVVVTADHGEELDDHGGRTHGTTLYEELIRVPLLVHLPGQTSHGEIDEPVSLIDVAPTVLDLVGIPSPRGWEGSSLAEAVVGPGLWGRLVAAVRWDRRTDERPVLSELLPKTKTDRVRHDRAIVRGSEKLLVSPTGAVEMFDLAADPHEKTPLEVGGAPRAALEAPLSALIERIRPATAPAPAVPDEIDEKTRERLKALGYAG